MHYQTIADTLASLINGDVSLDKNDLKSHSTDWSLFEMMPDMIVYPKDASDIQKLVSFVNEYNNKHKDNKLSLTARAAGSGMSGGSLNHSIIVDVTRYMNQVDTIQKSKDEIFQEVRKGFHYPISGTIWAEPGTKYLDFEKVTLHEDMLMPVFPASRKLCALGGMVANNGAGEKSLKYGQNKDFVKTLKVILADGNEYELNKLSYQELQSLISQKGLLSEIAKEVYELIKNNWNLIQDKKPQTSKNASGYLLWDVIDAPSIEDFENGEGHFDLTKLIVGAQGTTGIITDIEYKLVPQEDKEEMIVMFVNDMETLPKIVDILQRHDLDTIEMYDDHTFNIGIKFFGDFVKDKGLIPALRYGLRFLPEFKMAITGGVPKYIVLAESADNDAKRVHREVLNELKDINHALPKLKAFLVQGKDMQKYWDFRHDSFKMLTEHSMKSRKAGSGTRTAPFIDDIAIPTKHLPKYLTELQNILDDYQDEFVYTIAGHLGDGNFHIIPLVDMNKDENRQSVLDISEKVYKLVEKYHGSMSAEHNDGIIRTPYLHQIFGDEMVELFKQVKNIFDPHNIFNPGKKVGMTKEDIKKYLA